MSPQYTHQLLALPLLATGLAAPLYADFSHNEEKPNIIFFIVDDMGWQDTSLAFWRDTKGNAKETFLNKRYRTPHMEALAEQGMMFTRAYACTVSTPKRDSLMTGMNASRHRVTNWTLNADKSVDTPHPTLQAPEWNVNGLQPRGTRSSGKTKSPITEESVSYDMKMPYLSAPSKTLVQTINDAGYITIHCGKGHWGTKGTPGANPRNLGFDYNIAGKETGGIADYRGKNSYGKGQFQITGLRNIEKYKKENTFVTEALTLEALDLLNELKPQAGGKPFYLYMSHYAIHSPLDERANDVRFMKNYPEPSVGIHPADGKPWNLRERNYATLIEGMDKSLGDLMSWLKENNLEKNTVIVFVSDNGGLAISGRLQNANYPLSYGKGSLYEGGIRVPAIVKWPGVVKESSSSDMPIIIEDFYPTLLEIVKKPAKNADGISLIPTLQGMNAKNNQRPLIFHMPNMWGEGAASGQGYGVRSAIVLGDWKLIYDHATEKSMLFNLADDIHESNDLASKNPQKTKQMAQLLTSALKKRKAQMPIYKKDNSHVAWPH